MDNDDDRKQTAKTPKKTEKDSPGNQDTDKKVTPSKKQAAVSPSKRQASTSTPDSKKLSSEETLIAKGYANQLPSDKRPADEGDHRGKAAMAKKGNVHNCDLPVFPSYDRSKISGHRPTRGRRRRQQFIQ